MKIGKRLGIGAAALAAIVLMLTVTGYGGQLFFMAFIAYNSPPGEFDPEIAAPAPDYSLEHNWAALPSRRDLADLVPSGVDSPLQGELPVDVFFIHPTGFLTSASWTSPMDVESGTEENTSWMMANQASAFNGCCNVYAPRYREANIFAYFGELAVREAVLGFAYEDVKRALEYYLENYNHGRPFIIAGHSQGSHHAKRLLVEVIDASDLHERMVAAYMIGSIIIPVSPSWFDSMDHISPCAAEDDLHCVVAWDTMPEGALPLERDEDSLCTNPLSWRVNEELVDASLHQGALVPTGAFNTAMGKTPDTPTQQVYKALREPSEAQTWAQCRQGTLFVKADQGEELEVDAMGTFHNYDYALFYMNIRNNAKLRTARFLLAD